MVPLIEAALDRAVAIPSGTVHTHVEQLRRRNPEATPERIVQLLEREYLLVVQGTGGAVGAAAAMPAVGTGAALALTTSDVATFFAASAAFSLAVASVHGIQVDDTHRRRALLLATVLGPEGARAVGDVADISTLHVGRVLLTRMPMTTVKRVNNTLTRRLLRHQAARQTGLAVGRLLPFGVGAAVGVAGGRALGRTVVGGARAAFGAPPERFAEVIEVDPSVPALPSSAEPGGPRGARRLLHPSRRGYQRS